MTKIKDQEFRSFDQRVPDHKMLTDSESRVLKRYLQVPGNGSKSVNMDISFDYSTLIINQISGNVASTFDILVKSAYPNFFDGALSLVHHYQLYTIKLNDTDSTFWFNPLILPVHSMGQEVIVEIAEGVGNDAEFNIYLQESDPSAINQTSAIKRVINGTVTAGGNSTMAIVYPRRAKFVSVAFLVTDTNSVNKDYLVNARDEYYNVHTLESDLVQTVNFSYFDLIPINPGFLDFQYRVNNDDGSNSITWDLVYLKYYF